MRATLATKISMTVAGVVVLAMLSSGVGLALIGHFKSVTQNIVTENLHSVRAAEELRIAILEQRGFVSSYVLDGGRQTWLKELNRREPSFQHWLSEARAAAQRPEHQNMLDEIEQAYGLYRGNRAKVIMSFDQGSVDQARALLLGDLYSSYQQLNDLCEAFIDANNEFVNQQTAEVYSQVDRMRAIVLVCTALTIGLGALLLGLFFRDLLLPLRRMAADVRSFATAHDQPEEAVVPGDELQAIGAHLQRLMSDVAATRSSLEQQETEMRHMDKLVTVGRLAASVAHEIRNPLTSVKMWLFSMRQSLGHTPELDHKFDVVSGEINRLENIVHNFLDFSRRPNLKPMPQTISSLLDKTLELFRYRFAQQGVELIRKDQPDLPLVLVDPEQIMQVLVNVLDNALSAMGSAGKIWVTAERSEWEGRPMARVRVTDTGPGMTEEVRARIFDPFFTTKEEGTGLGLTIAAAIMAQHGGRLVPEPSKQGGVFALWIPAITEATNDG